MRPIFLSTVYSELHLTNSANALTEKNMKVKIAAVQFQPDANDFEKNLSKIISMTDKALSSGAKIAILPEICDFAYDMKAMKLNFDKHAGEATSAISQLAKKHRALIAAGLADKRGDDFFNTCTLFDSTGAIAAKYDKNHLCVVPPYDEPLFFKYGEKIFTKEMQIDGEKIKLGFSICFDIRFPELYRKLAAEGAELVIHPTAFPMMRIEQFEVCARARTIENQFFFAAANVCGTTGGVQLGGNSLILAPEGKIIARASRDCDETLFATIDTSEIAQSRKERPVYSCCRPEIY